MKMLPWPEPAMCYFYATDFQVAGTELRELVDFATNARKARIST